MLMNSCQVEFCFSFEKRTSPQYAPRSEVHFASALENRFSKQIVLIKSGGGVRSATT